VFLKESVCAFRCSITNTTLIVYCTACCIQSIIHRAPDYICISKANILISSPGPLWLRGYFLWPQIPWSFTAVGLILASGENLYERKSSNWLVIDQWFYPGVHLCYSRRVPGVFFHWLLVWSHNMTDNYTAEAKLSPPILGFCGKNSFCSKYIICTCKSGALYAVIVYDAKLKVYVLA